MPCQKVVKHTDRKEIITHLIEQLRISERLASHSAGLSQKAYRYLAGLEVGPINIHESAKLVKISPSSSFSVEFSPHLNNLAASP